jgi:hypothetical protein
MTSRNRIRKVDRQLGSDHRDKPTMALLSATGQVLAVFGNGRLLPTDMFGRGEFDAGRLKAFVGIRPGAV